MKRSSLFVIAGIIALAVTTAFITPSNNLTPSARPSGIPDSVFAILEKSCIDCHVSEASGTAKIKLNFDKWDSYDSEKQLKKARDLYSEMKDGKMPPAKYKKDDPNKVPSREDIQIIYNWIRHIEK